MSKLISVLIVLLAITIYLVTDLFTSTVATEGDERRPKDCCADFNSCNNPFVYSQPFEGKRFMIPWSKDERKGDWFNNIGYCKKHCAEMVTIQSEEENKHFLDFARRVGVSSPGVWLGGIFANVTSPTSEFYWVNEEPVSYSPMVNGEPNQSGFTCLHAAYDNAGVNALKWRNWHCTVDTITFACQRMQAGNGDKRLPIVPTL